MKVISCKPSQYAKQWEVTISASCWDEIYRTQSNEFRQHILKEWSDRNKMLRLGMITDSEDKLYHFRFMESPATPEHVVTFDQILVEEELDRETCLEPPF
jgi:hypothetical protein